MLFIKVAVLPQILEIPNSIPEIGITELGV
jgi:hypothetical protein